MIVISNTQKSQQTDKATICTTNGDQYGYRDCYMDIAYFQRRRFEYIVTPVHYFFVEIGFKFYDFLCSAFYLFYF